MNQLSMYRIEQTLNLSALPQREGEGEGEKGGERRRKTG